MVSIVENNTRRTKVNEENVNSVLAYMGRIEERLNDLHEGFHRVAATFLLAQDDIAANFPLKTVEEVLAWSSKDTNLLMFRTR